MTGVVEVSGTSTISFSPNRDNTLYEDPTGQLSNGQGIYFFDGKNGSNRASRVGRVRSQLDPHERDGHGCDAFPVPLDGFRGFPDGFLEQSAAGLGEGASNAGDPGGNGTQAAAGDATWLQPSTISVFGSSRRRFFADHQCVHDGGRGENKLHLERQRSNRRRAGVGLQSDGKLWVGHSWQ